MHVPRSSPGALPGTSLGAALVLCLGLLAPAGEALAQSFPSRPLKLVVTFPAGGPVDAIGRVLAQRLAGPLGQQVLVDNRPGADGLIGAEAVARSPADGHTLYLAPAGHAINASLYAKVPYDSVRDFTPITLIGEAPNLVTINPNVPAANLREFVALAKSRKGQLNYGATSPPTHLATELLLQTAGMEITRIPFKGAAPATTALLAGDVQLVLSGIGTMLPHVKAGKLRGLAVTGAKRSPLAPDIPTVEEAGVSGYVATTWYGILAPANTPRPIVDRLNADFRKILADPEMKAQLLTQGVEPSPSTPEEFGRFLTGEIARWEKVVKATGARVD